MASLNIPATRAVGTCAATITAALALAGCTTYDTTQRDVEIAIQNWRRPVAPVAATSQPAPAGAAAPARGPATPPGPPAEIAPLRPVDRYIHEALARNPGIQAATADARAKLHRIPQVSSLPDPVLRAVARPEPIQTAAGDTYFTLAVSQMFPLLAKLERAGDIAAAETRVALEQLQARRVQLIADVERAYWQIYRLDRYLEITRENRRVLEDLRSVVETQYQVGKVPQQDLLRVQTELGKLRDDEFRFGVQRDAAAAALNRLTDQPPQREIPPTGPIDAPATLADVEELIALATDHNPTLAALRQRLEQNRQQAALADLGYWPDLMLGFEWNYLDGRPAFIPPVNPMTGQRPAVNRMSEGGDDNWGISIQLNLPIWSQRIESARREARQRLLATQSELHDSSNMVAFRIFEAWSRVEAQQHTLHVLESELIPQSRQTYEVTLTSYQAGDTSFVTLIDHWRRWLEFELMRHRETVDLETAFTDLQRDIGMQLLRRQADARPAGDDR